MGNIGFFLFSTCFSIQQFCLLLLFLNLIGANPGKWLSISKVRNVVVVNLPGTRLYSGRNLGLTPLLLFFIEVARKRLVIRKTVTVGMNLVKHPN